MVQRVGAVCCHSGRAPEEPVSVPFAAIPDGPHRADLD